VAPVASAIPLKVDAIGHWLAIDGLGGAIVPFPQLLTGRGYAHEWTAGGYYEPVGTKWIDYWSKSCAARWDEFALIRRFIDQVGRRKST
jgi:hypothetical protein